MKITIEISDDDAMHINALIEHTKLYDRAAQSGSYGRARRHRAEGGRADAA
jgi:hypothetical protein